MLIVGNTAYGHTGTNDRGISVGSGVARYNVVYGNYDGINVGSGGIAEYNRVYANSNRGLVTTNNATLIGNVVYSNRIGIDLRNTNTVRNNLVYANTDFGIFVSNGSPVIESNTIYQPLGDALRIGETAANMNVSNNIFWVQNGRAVTVESDSQVGFASDYNWFFLDGAGAIAGEWQGVDRQTLTDWNNAAFTDFNSFMGDPLFVNPDGGDGFGFFDQANDGRNDDFHLQSLNASLHDGSLAPVQDAVSGLPVLLPGMLTADGAQSPAIDRGDAASAFGNEPAPDGGFINIGAHGNTNQASLSPAQYIWVQNPFAGANVSQESDYTVKWRSFGFVDTVDIEVSPTGLPGDYQALATGEADDGEFTWNVDPLIFPQTATYLLRIFATSTPSITDETDGPFNVGPPITVYYVNDTNPDLTDDEYTTAPGNDANDGLTQGAPKASLQSVLAAYVLGPGDIILVDTGNYAVTTNIIITIDDAGVEIRGPVESGHTAVLNRGNFTSSARVFELIDADGTIFSNLHITGSNDGIYASGTSNSDDLTLINLSVYGNDGSGVLLSTGTDGLTVVGGEYYDNQTYGVSVTNATGATVTDALFYNSATPIFIQGIGLRLFNITNSMVQNVTAYGMDQTGISVTGAGSEVRESLAYNNANYGISIGGGVLATENTTYGHLGAVGGGRAAGLSGGGTFLDNISYGNADGIRLGSGGLAERNTVFGNTDRGIWFVSGDAAIIDNEIFDNRIGAVVGFRSEATNNLIYGNADYGLFANSSDTDLRNNTIRQSTGEGIWVSANNVRLNSNILWVEGGPAIRVDDDSQVDFTSDYNLFYLTGTGSIGLWEGKTFTSRADWFYELGLDEHSIVTDPVFVDPDGADDVPGLEKTVLDNSDAAFSTLGNWTEVFDAAAGGGSYLLRDNGDNGTATWDFTGLANGKYLLYGEWPQVVGNGFADYAVSDGGGLLANFNGINQQTTDRAYIGTVDVSDGTLSVTQSYSTTSYRMRADRLILSALDGGVATDDDFHLQATSPGIDRGDPVTIYIEEPLPNGSRINVGAYGTTAEATQSAAEMVQVLSPNGLEKLEIGDNVAIDWRIAGLLQEEVALLLNVGSSDAVSDPLLGNWLANQYQGRELQPTGADRPGGCDRGGQPAAAECLRGLCLRGHEHRQ